MPGPNDEGNGDAAVARNAQRVYWIQRASAGTFFCILQKRVGTAK